MVAEHFAEGPGSRGRPKADKGEFYGNWFQTQLHSAPCGRDNCAKGVSAARRGILHGGPARVTAARTVPKQRYWKAHTKSLKFRNLV